MIAAEWVGQKVAPEAWLLTWFCVTIMNPSCMKWDGVTEQAVTSFNSEVECASYATKIARKVHTSFNFDLKYVCRKGVRPEPYRP